MDSFFEKTCQIILPLLVRLLRPMHRKTLSAIPHAILFGDPLFSVTAQTPRTQITRQKQREQELIAARANGYKC